MLTVQTKPDCTLGFALGWKNPDGNFVFQLNQDIEFTPVTPEAYIGFKADFAKMDEVGFFEKGDKINIIGKLSEITEEQARELMEVDKGHIGFGRICNYLYGLKESAKAVGIEEKDFDKYLIIKL
jgi:hypothetical protein